MSPKNKELSELEKSWYKKLKDSGFEDIEANEDMLKSWAGHFFRSKRYNESRYLAIQNYYIQAEHFLNDHRFADKKEQLIWKNHSEGMSSRDSVDVLKEAGLTVGRDTVSKIIKSLKNKMFELYGND